MSPPFIAGTAYLISEAGFAMPSRMSTFKGKAGLGCAEVFHKGAEKGFRRVYIVV
jgi:hypothetical protein